MKRDVGDALIERNWAGFTKQLHLTNEDFLRATNAFISQKVQPIKS